MSQQHAMAERTSEAYAGPDTTQYAAGATLEQLFLEMTVRAPGATALLGDEGSLSYSDLLIRAQNVAALLRTRGVRPGDCVGIIARRSFATVSAIVGTLLAGAVYVMFDLDARGDAALRQQCAICRVRLLLADVGDGALEFPWAGSTAVIDLQAIEREIMPLFAQMQLPKVAPDGPATVVFEEENEGVLITHRGLVALVSSLRSSSDLPHPSAEDRLLLRGNACLQVWHLQLWGCLLSGATLVLEPPGGFGAAAFEQDEDDSFAPRTRRTDTVPTQTLTPEEIEALLAKHPLVLQCAVVPLPPVQPGLCAFVSLRAADAKGESKLRAHILAHVPQASQPRFLLILPSLPVEAAGDVDRQRLLEDARVLVAGKGPQADEAAGVLEQVRAVWQRLLHRMQVGLDDDFFAAGGTSVQMIRLHAELNRRFPGAITMADLPALTTIRKMLQHLSTETTRDRMVALAKRGA